jgi:hypothetical protein
MIHCYNCGADMPDNMLYCTTCGKKLDVPEMETQVLGQPAAPTVRNITTPATQPFVQKKRGRALKALILAVIGVLLAGVIVVVAAVLFVMFSKRSSVAANSNFDASINRASNIADVNVNSVTPDANAIIDNAMKEIQKAANDALAAANKAANIQVPTGKILDGRTTRIEFRPGAVNATAVGTVEESATFVLRAKSGQTLSARLTSPNGCIKFEDGDSASMTSETDSGDNYITVTNTCGKPTSMVLSVTIK